MILLLSCVQNSWKWPHIQENWLHPSKIPYVILIGNPNIPRKSHIYDASSHVLQVGCADNYDELVYKIAYGISAIVERFDPCYLLKIDDDVVINVPLLHLFMQSNTDLFHTAENFPLEDQFTTPTTANILGVPDVTPLREVSNPNDDKEFGGILYGGIKVDITKSSRLSGGIDKFTDSKNKTPITISHMSYCGGPMYYLKKPATNVLSQHMNPATIVYEDVNVGKTLGDNGIHPEDLPLYTNDFEDFTQNKCIGWHDVNREHTQNIFVKNPKLIQSRLLDLKSVA